MHCNDNVYGACVCLTSFLLCIIAYKLISVVSNKTRLLLAMHMLLYLRDSALQTCNAGTVCANVLRENTAAISHDHRQILARHDMQFKVSSHQTMVALWYVFYGFEIVLQASDQASCL
jgi:hypothetical protein